MRICNDSGCLTRAELTDSQFGHFVQHRMRCQIFYIFLGASQKISIKIAQPSTPKPVSNVFFPYASEWSFIFFAIALVALSTVDRLFMFGTFDLYTDTHAQPRIIMIIAHAAFVTVWYTAGTPPDGILWTLARRLRIPIISRRDTELCIIITFWLGIGSCSCGIFALVCRRRGSRFFFHPLVGTWNCG